MSISAGEPQSRRNLERKNMDGPGTGVGVQRKIANSPELTIPGYFTDAIVVIPPDGNATHSRLAHTLGTCKTIETSLPTMFRNNWLAERTPVHWTICIFMVRHRFAPG